MPGGEEIASAEGTTQGDSIPTPIHTLGSLSLLDMTARDSTKHATYADDTSCVGKLKNVLTWWN